MTSSATAAQESARSGARQRADEPGPAADAGPVTGQADWFLPGGRAELLPDSVTVSFDEADSGQPPRQQAAPAAAGAPPWAAETTGSAAGAPPPWESGPWPGPGAARPSPPPAVDTSNRPSQPAARHDEAAGAWTPRAVLVTGVLPLVVPGLVVGLLGLRRSRSGEPGRRASLLAVAASLAWAVVIVVLVAVGTGGSTAGCTYPAAVHQAYARAMADIGGGVPSATLAADLGVAAGTANSAEASVSQIGVRTALSVMEEDLQQARADVAASRVVPIGLKAHLTADGAALTASCPA